MSLGALGKTRDDRGCDGGAGNPLGFKESGTKTGLATGRDAARRQWPEGALAP